MGRTGKVYRKIRSNFTDKPTFFSWVVEKKVAASGRPYSKEQVDWLRANGVNAILSLTEQPLPEEWTRGMEVHHISMKDHAPPEVSDLWEAADDIAYSIAEGKVILVHCLAGKGRTGCALAAYMIVHQGKTAREAVEALRAMRPGSVEMPQQERVFEFEEHVLKERSTQRTR